MTKKQRIEIIKKTIKSVEEGQEFICILIGGHTYRATQDYCERVSELTWKYFPELKKYKPKNTPLNYPWFDESDGQAKRLEVLNELLKEIS